MKFEMDGFRQLIFIILFIVIINFVLITYVGYLNKRISFDFARDVFSDSMRNYYLRDVLYGYSKEIEVKSPEFKQQKKKSCGAAALRYLLYQYGIKKSEKELRDLIGTDEKEGSSLYRMVKVANKLGMKSSGFRVNYKELRQMEKPVIALLINPESPIDHYVVVENMESNYVYFFDPAPKQGKIKLQKNKFLSIWNGIIMTVDIKPIK